MLDLKLSFHQDEVYKKSKLEEDLIIQEISQLPPLNEGVISIDGIYTVKWEEQLEVGFYLRNGSSDNIYFGEVPIRVINSEGNIIAKQTVNLSVMGDIPPMSVRPWKFYINNDNLYVENINNDGKFSIIFDVNDGDTPFIKIIEDKEPEPLTEEQTNRLFAYLKSLPPLEEGQTKVAPFEISMVEEGLKVTIIVRRGAPSAIRLSRFQLGVLDASNRCVAKAVFNIEPYTLEPNTFFLRTFTFPLNTILYNDIDLSRWSVKIL